MSALDDIRTALTDVYGTGPVLDGLTADDMVKAVVTEYQLDAQAYPGELDMLRGLVRTLRVLVREDSSLAEVRWLLHKHSDDDRDARAEVNSPKAADAARQAVLLEAVLANPTARWKSGLAISVLREHGFHPVSPSTASHDLSALAAAGHLVRHEEPGVRWYEVADRTGGGSCG